MKVQVHQGRTTHWYEHHLKTIYKMKLQTQTSSKKQKEPALSPQHPTPWPLVGVSFALWMALWHGLLLMILRAVTTSCAENLQRFAQRPENPRRLLGCICWVCWGEGVGQRWILDGCLRGLDGFLMDFWRILVWGDLVWRFMLVWVLLCCISDFQRACGIVWWFCLGFCWSLYMLFLCWFHVFDYVFCWVVSCDSVSSPTAESFGTLEIHKPGKPILGAFTSCDSDHFTDLCTMHALPPWCRRMCSPRFDIVQRLDVLWVMGLCWTLPISNPSSMKAIYTDMRSTRAIIRM